MKFVYLKKNEQPIPAVIKQGTIVSQKPILRPTPVKQIYYKPKVAEGERKYYKLLGLAREPFSMTPDPDFFYQSKQHQEGVNRLEISLRLNRGLHVVVGGVGTGKTTISRLLLDRFTNFESEYTFFLILNPTWRNNQEFLLHLKKMFNINDESNIVTDMMNQIEHFLIDYTIKYNKRIVVIIDEGQKMGSNQLEVLRSLLNFETNNLKLIQFAIFAQPEFIETINSMENFKDRISFMFHIHNIDLEDTFNFIKHRLNIAGISDGRELFTENAKNFIYEYTNGFPRKIIVICHNLLIDMLIAGKSIVDADLVYQYIQPK